MSAYPIPTITDEAMLNNIARQQSTPKTEDKISEKKPVEEEKKKGFTEFLVNNQTVILLLALLIITIIVLFVYFYWFRKDKKDEQGGHWNEGYDDVPPMPQMMPPGYYQGPGFMPQGMPQYPAQPPPARQGKQEQEKEQEQEPPQTNPEADTEADPDPTEDFQDKPVKKVSFADEVQDTKIKDGMDELHEYMNMSLEEEMSEGKKD